jgi:hypothetical protein
MEQMFGARLRMSWLEGYFGERNYGRTSSIRDGQACISTRVIRSLIRADGTNGRYHSCYETGKLCANDDISRALTDSGQLPVSLGRDSDRAVYDTTAAVNGSNGAMDKLR